MIRVIKGETPEWFSALINAHKNWRYHDLSIECRRKLRENLLKEQYYLCGYCCAEIHQENAHNEHLKPKGKFPQENLSYANFIASCMGYKQQGETCGHKKGDHDQEIILPLDDDCECQFTYNLDGVIEGNTPKAKQTIEVLNLNTYELRTARKAVLNASFYYPKEALCFYEEPTAGRLPAFCNIVRNMVKQYGDQWDQMKNMIGNP